MKRSFLIILVLTLSLTGCTIANNIEQTRNTEFETTEKSKIADGRNLPVRELSNKERFILPMNIYVDKKLLESDETVQLCLDELETSYSLVSNTDLYELDSYEDDQAIIYCLANQVYSENQMDLAKKLKNKGDQAYAIEITNSSVTIVANKTIGLLYGTYDFLEVLGFMWPSANRTVIPSPMNIEETENQIRVETPDVNLRGVWTYEVADDDFVRWMARNRFNLVGIIDSNLAKAYGFTIWLGGHEVLQDFLADETLFIEHPEFYGLRNNERISVEKDTPNYMNPCFSNNDFVEAFASYLGDTYGMAYEDSNILLNIWPTDSSSSNYFCQCNDCNIIGNSSDNLLSFYDKVISIVNQKYSNIKINGISYYSTWDLPKHSYDLNANYNQVLYLNQRSFTKPIYENTTIPIQEWIEYSKENQINIGVVEYYNYSIYGGMISDYENVITSDIPFYVENGVDLFAYMHPLSVNGGFFDKANYLLGKLLWDSDTDVKSVNQIYYSNLYGENYQLISEIYRTVDLAMSNRKQMLGQNSLKFCLFQEAFWAVPPYSSNQIDTFLVKYLTGGIQQVPSRFQSDQEFSTEEFIGLEESIILLDETLRKLEKIYEKNGNKKIEEDLMWLRAAYDSYYLLYELALYRINRSSNIPYDEEIIYRMTNTIESIHRFQEQSNTVSRVDPSPLFTILKNEKVILPKEIKTMMKEY